MAIKQRDIEDSGADVRKALEKGEVAINVVHEYRAKSALEVNITEL